MNLFYDACIALACEEKGIIIPDQCRELFDHLTGQSLQARAHQLTEWVQTAVEYSPDQLDVFLCILHEKGNVAIQVVAGDIARSCELKGRD